MARNNSSDAIDGTNYHFRYFERPIPVGGAQEHRKQRLEEEDGDETDDIEDDPEFELKSCGGDCCDEDCECDDCLRCASNGTGTPEEEEEGDDGYPGYQAAAG